jgi:hypothetical protein
MPEQPSNPLNAVVSLVHSTYLTSFVTITWFRGSPTTSSVPTADADVSAVLADDERESVAGVEIV